MTTTSSPRQDPVVEMGESDAWPAQAPPGGIAVAVGATFSFGYAQTSELLAAAGAEVVEFDPLHDESVLPLTARPSPHVTLGRRTAVALRQRAVWIEGRRVNGHEFHCTQIGFDADGPALAAWAWKNGASRSAIESLAGVGAVHASYLHVHWATYAAMIARFDYSAAEVA